MPTSSGHTWNISSFSRKTTSFFPTSVNKSISRALQTLRVFSLSFIFLSFIFQMIYVECKKKNMKCNSFWGGVADTICFLIGCGVGISAQTKKEKREDDEMDRPCLRNSQSQHVLALFIQSAVASGSLCRWFRLTDVVFRILAAARRTWRKIWKVNNRAKVC